MASIALAVVFGFTTGVVVGEATGSPAMAAAASFVSSFMVTLLTSGSRSKK